MLSVCKIGLTFNVLIRYKAGNVRINVTLGRVRAIIVAGHKH